MTLFEERVDRFRQACIAEWEAHAEHPIGPGGLVCKVNYGCHDLVTRYVAQQSLAFPATEAALWLEEGVGPANLLEWPPPDQDGDTLGEMIVNAVGDQAWAIVFPVDDESLAPRP